MICDCMPEVQIGFGAQQDPDQRNADPVECLCCDLLFGIAEIRQSLQSYRIRKHHQRHGKTATEIPVEGGAVGLIDFQLLSFVMALTFIYLMSFLFIVAGAFYWMARQCTGFVRRRFTELAIGFTIFVGAGAIDSLVELAYFIVIPRFFMLLAYILMYIGFTRTK